MENGRETVHNDDCQECIHHWLIDEKNFGVCKKCGASKQFCGSWNTRGWGNRSSKVQPSVPGTKS